jgi:thiol-disulfide isomerase/thioredoxin
MGKGTRNRAQSARQRIAEQQAAARRAERRRQVLLSVGAVVVVVAVVVVFVVIKATSGGSSGSTASGGVNGTLLPASVQKDITTVPDSALQTVGTGSVLSYNSKPITTIKGTSLTSGGKPQMLYIGAEFCPYCAAMRWSMAVALSKFGTLSPLHGIHSSSTDTDPNTPTLTFYKSTYTSKYLVFNSVEMNSEKPVGNGYATLQKPTAAESALLTKYDAPPYIPSANSGAIPFVDIGNQYLISGSQYLPSALGTTQSVSPGHFGLTWTQIASDVKNPSSPVAKDIDGAANSITAAICKITNNADTAVCNSAAATAGAGSL